MSNNMLMNVRIKKIQQFQVDYILNIALKMNKAFIEQVGSNLALTPKNGPYQKIVS